MRNREIPKGLRDLLPDEVKIKRNIENQAASLFTGYGYEEVITPAFEYLEVIESGAGSNIREELFMFMDREGGILTLRPEMTVSIARLAATHMQDEALPLRLYYMGNVFRHVQPQKARYREFWQAGIELLGTKGPWADAEIITIAAKTLSTIGLSDFKISLNHIGIFNSILEESNMNHQDMALIRQLVESKDLVELSQVLESLPINERLKETIASLPVLHGGLETIGKIPYLEDSPKAREAVSELLKIYEALNTFGVIEHIVLDMGVLRGLDYYTGIVFEGYSPDLGYGLLGGGRYDNLLGQFGFPCPATGFALGLERTALVLKDKIEEPRRYLVGGTDFQAMVNKCDELRSSGFIAEMDTELRGRGELLKICEKKLDTNLVYID
ncbi:MAG TPA: ATP phosphoribosyltransferase regulatory subunit [Syntrophomonadaceae bacterium]|nr:ATP phosphoribosyltransferase regulatory subunit [Syntrophomonadaceae bacterium]HPR92907.1 ATP phosphoribosyltransferase regulatory subunit [Syntrophomonadaceae bacterium]